MNARNYLVAGICSLALFALACDGTGTPAGIQGRVELQRFNTCQGLGKYIQDVAADSMHLYLEEQLEYARKYSHGYGSADAGMAMSDSGSSSSTPSTPDKPKSHTETNNQVQGVDEPDFVKNDGTRILVLSGNALYLSKSWPPNKLSAVGHEGS